MRELQRKLSEDQGLALKQIRTGFRKWIARYLMDCNNEAEQAKHSTRLHEISEKIKEAFENLRQDYRRKK